MGFFDSISSGFKGVFNGAKDFGGSIFNTAKGGVSSIFSGLKDVAAPITTAAGKILDTAGKFAEKGLNRLDSVADMLSNPLFLIGGGIIALMILSKVMDK